MGHTRHHTVIVTGWDNDDLGEAHAKAGEIYARHLEGREGLQLVGHIQNGLLNGYATFVIIPDGSNEGRLPSEQSNAARAEFVEWLRSVTQVDWGRNRRLHLEWVELEFGDEETRATKVLAHGGDEKRRQDEPTLKPFLVEKRSTLHGLERSKSFATLEEARQWSEPGMDITVRITPYELNNLMGRNA